MPSLGIFFGDLDFRFKATATTGDGQWRQILTCDVPCNVVGAHCLRVRESTSPQVAVGRCNSVSYLGKNHSSPSGFRWYPRGPWPTVEPPKSRSPGVASFGWGALRAHPSNRPGARQERRNSLNGWRSQTDSNPRTSLEGVDRLAPANPVNPREGARRLHRVSAGHGAGINADNADGRFKLHVDEDDRLFGRSAALERRRRVLEGTGKAQAVRRIPLNRWDAAKCHRHTRGEYMRLPAVLEVCLMSSHLPNFACERCPARRSSLHIAPQELRSHADSERQLIDCTKAVRMGTNFACSRATRR